LVAPLHIVCFHFDGCGVIHTGAPLGDIEKVCAPIGDVAGSVVVDPAEIEMAARGSVGSLERWALPHCVIEMRGHGRRGFESGEVVLNGEFARHADFDLFELADVAVAHALTGHADFKTGATPSAALQDAFVFLHGAADGAAFGNAGGERLFGIEIFAAFGGSDGDIGMPVVGCRIQDDINVRTREEFAEVTVEVARSDLGESRGGFEMLRVDIRKRDDLHALICEEGAKISGALSTETDAAHAEPAVGGDGTRATERGGGDEQREGRFEEAAAGGHWRKGVVGWDL
jgi:hypothetical protein